MSCLSLCNPTHMSIRLMYSPFRGLGGWLMKCPLALDNDGVWLSFQPRTTLKSSKDTRCKRSTMYPSLQTRGSRGVPSAKRNNSEASHQRSVPTASAFQQRQRPNSEASQQRSVLSAKRSISEAFHQRSIPTAKGYELPSNHH